MGSPRPVVERIETFGLEAPLPEGGYGASKVLLPARVCTLVKLSCSDGTIGWGESFGPPRLVAPLLEQYGRALLGRAVDDRESFLLDTCSVDYHFATTGLPIAALSGLDIALWDAQARAFGVPVAHLLGGAVRSEVGVYASTGYMTRTRDLDEFRVQLQQAADEGLRAVKIKIGSGIAEDRARTEIAREVFGDDGTVMIDYNANATADVVLRSLSRLLDLDPAWVEEPVPPYDTDGWAEIKRLGVPIAAGEALYTRYGFRDSIAGRRMDIVEPDVTKTGGFTEAKAIAQLATTFNLRTSPHCWGTGLAQAATLQLLAHLPDAPFGHSGAPPHVLELDRGVNPLREGVLAEPLRHRSGVMDIPQGPGLGVHIDEDWLRRHALPEASHDIHQHWAISIGKAHNE